MSVQILIVDDGFQLLAGGEPVGSRRQLDDTAVSALADLAVRYRLLVRAPNAVAGLIALGRDLFAWLDGEGGACTELLWRAPRPLLWEIRGPLEPTPAEWAMLRAPWELLADRDGHLARNPILGLLEGEGGEPRPTDAAALVRALRSAPPRVLFLSACLSATPSGDGHGGVNGADHGGSVAAPAVDAPAHSLASLLISAGTPAVLGWDGSVADRAASAFACRLYADLAHRLEPAHAVAGARLALLEADDLVLSGDWHLARLWLGPDGDGPLVGGLRKHSLLPATHGQKELLGKRVPLASHEMFVGRRRQLQQALRRHPAASCSGPR